MISTPVDQTFRCCDPNLCHLKAVAVKEVSHLTMIIILDKDHMHYSDAFGNIFKEDTLQKKQFPDGLEGIMMSKGGVAHVIVCHFCPSACSNDDYTYHHLVATHLNIQWGCGICFEFINRYMSKIREHVLSHQKKSSREQSQSSCKEDKDEVLGSPSDSIFSDEVSDGDSPGGEDDHDWSGSASDEVSKEGSDQDSA